VKRTLGLEQLAWMGFPSELFNFKGPPSASTGVGFYFV